MTRKQILVVEDDIIIVMELESRLQELGYAVCGTTSYGEEAIKKAEALRPDLVLMDIQLKGVMDGIAAAQEIRARFDIPVVYLTAHADGDTLWRAKFTEPYGYVIKPFDERGLRSAIEMAMHMHEMEGRLRESQEWLSATLRSIGHAVIATDEWGRIALINPMAEILTGCEAERAQGRWIAEILQVAPEEASRTAENAIGRTLGEGLSVDLAGHLLLTADGKEIPIDGNTAPITDDQGRIKGMVVVFRDASERKREEEERTELQVQLFQAQKMEAVGVLTGQLAHSFNNLMTTVVGFSSLLLSGLADEDTQHSGLEFVKRAGEQAAFLTRQILTLSRRPAPQSRILDLNALIIGMEEVMQTLGGEGVDVSSSLEPELWHIRADPAEIEHVIINLVLNAQQAMPEGGKLVIKTESVVHEAGQTGENPEAYAGAFVRLSVTDTGIGMSQETLERIFEPFFSTKATGTGLGLSIAQRMARQYEGWIEVRSESGKGSTFRVYLPACFEEPEPEAPEPMPLLEVQGAGERILLAEDDEGVRAAVSEMLRAGGYVVLEAASMAEALQRFEASEEAPDLVLCDVVLPDGDGLQLVESFLASKPGLAVLLTSGYTDDRVPWALVAEKGYRLLQKPFGIGELLPAVREALAADGMTSSR